jgi:hypothetical protein
MEGSRFFCLSLTMATLLVATLAGRGCIATYHKSPYASHKNDSHYNGYCCNAPILPRHTRYIISEVMMKPIHATIHAMAVL